jgi:hypothetical protein
MVSLPLFACVYCVDEVQEIMEVLLQKWAQIPIAPTARKITSVETIIDNEDLEETVDRDSEPAPASVALTRKKIQWESSSSSESESGDN